MTIAMQRDRFITGRKGEEERFCRRMGCPMCGYLSANWVEMKEAMNKVLDSTTLQDLAERQKRKGHPEEANERGILSKGTRRR
jgi:DNA-binding IscR family transcriptional regulator